MLFEIVELDKSLTADGTGERFFIRVYSRKKKEYIVKNIKNRIKNTSYAV